MTESWKRGGVGELVCVCERERATYSSLAEQLDGPVWCAEDDRHSFTCALFGKKNKQS